MRIDYAELLEFFFCGLETFSRRDCGLILAGARAVPNEQRADELLKRMQQRRLIDRVGRGGKARYRVTATGRKQANRKLPSEHWGRSWDGKWRVFSFDLPSGDRRERMALWRALRDAKFGLLQRSTWIWPHEIEVILRDIVESRGLPECFCGFEAGRLFLCNHEEVVRAAWDWEEIGRRHQTYVNHPVIDPESVRRTKDVLQLARLGREERVSYGYAFLLDPMLPRSLWPVGYGGVEVEERHQRFRMQFERRFHDLAS